MDFGPSPIIKLLQLMYSKMSELLLWVGLILVVLSFGAIIFCPCVLNYWCLFHFLILATRVMVPRYHYAAFAFSTWLQPPTPGCWTIGQEMHTSFVYTSTFLIGDSLLGLYASWIGYSFIQYEILLVENALENFFSLDRIPRVYNFISSW